MKVRDNLWWIILGAFWTTYTIGCLAYGEIFPTVLGVLSLATLILYVRRTVNLCREIRCLKVTIASLELALKEAHRHDRR